MDIEIESESAEEEETEQSVPTERQRMTLGDANLEIPEPIAERLVR